jgi:hypothetical protein
MMEREKMGSYQKGVFMLKCLSPLKMLTPLYLKRLLELFFLFLSLFFTPSLVDLGGLVIVEEKITSSKTSFQVASRYSRWTHITEWSYAWQHG